MYVFGRYLLEYEEAVSGAFFKFWDGMAGDFILSVEFLSCLNVLCRSGSRLRYYVPVSKLI